MKELTQPAPSLTSAAPFGGRPPIFVGGLPRSGTTLVARLLASHSEIALPPSELGFFNVLWRPGQPPNRAMSGRDEFDLRLQRVLARTAPWGLPEHAILEASRGVPATYRDLFVFVLDLYRRSTGKARAAEKSVYYHQWLHVLDAWFEDYRFVHVVRDPVDAFASLKWFKRGTPRPNRVDLVPWLHEWNESATVALRRSHLRPDRYCVVRYEELVSRPVETLERACLVAGVRTETERMLRMGAGEAAESSFASEVVGAEYTGGVRGADRVDRARRIEPGELRAIRSACAPLAHLLGYDFAPRRTRRPSLGQPVPGRIPFDVAAPFLARRVRDGVRRRRSRG